VTNKHTPVTIEKEIIKVWDDNDDQDGIRPESVEVVLTGSDGSERKVTLDGTADTAPTGTDPAGYESEAWKAKYINLPKYKAGVEITYTYSETETAVITGTDGEGTYAYSWADNTVTNKHTPLKTKVKVTKVWDDNDDQDGVRDDYTFTVQLYKTVNGTKTAVGESVEVGIMDGWYKEWTDLPVYEDGSKITYSVEETIPDGAPYEKEGDEVTLEAKKDDSGTIEITNTHTPEVTTITVKKVWKDKKDAAKKRKEVKALFYLQQTVNGVSTEVYYVEVGKNDEWTYTWSNLPVYEHGEQIIYSVREVLEVSNGYSGDTLSWHAVPNDGIITITNTLRDETPPTGDHTKILLWTSVLMMSTIGCGGALWIAMRKKKEAEQ